MTKKIWEFVHMQFIMNTMFRKIKLLSQMNYLQIFIILHKHYA